MAARGVGGQRSLTGAILHRGLRVMVCHPDDNDGATLTRHLSRMGFHVEACWPPPEVLPPKVDVVFRALVPEQPVSHAPFQGSGAPPLISIIAYENPTFIDQALKMGANAIITTPIRTSGLLSTVVFAFQHARQQRQYTDRIFALEQKLNGARHLNRAKSILMSMHRISETDAYEILRGQAMEKRVSVNDVCLSVIQASELLSFDIGKQRPSRASPRADD